MYYYGYSVDSFELMDDGTIEVIKRYPSNITLASCPPRPVPDRVVKEIYAAVDEKIVLIKTIEGTTIPAVPERVVFE